MDTYNCIDDEEQKDFAFVEIYLSPGIDEDYKMKFCFPGNQYGVEKRYTGSSYTPSQFRFNQLGRKTNLKADYTSSTFIENETINKGFNPAIQFKQFSDSGLSPLELFSSDIHASSLPIVRRLCKAPRRSLTFQSRAVLA